MKSILDIPEIADLDAKRHLVRIPPELDVPLTPRVTNLIDSADFRRLASVSQLGLVSLVYPSANHTRFEHSLGVYRIALLCLRRLAYEPHFAEIVSPRDAELFLVAALLHDLGHWPFCHPIEDMRLASVPRHELFANSFLLEGEIADVLREEWNIQPREVVKLLSEKPRDPSGRLLASILSGPIDIDKMDYLARDSLHAGVPYGMNFDQNRLIGSLCLNAAGDRLAVTEKGKTAAEMMLFARYVMFSEVYWHHTVRSATAMLQRAFYLLHSSLDLDGLFRMTESKWIEELTGAAGRTGAAELISGLFGPARRLYKRVTEYSFFERQELYALLARCPYPRLSACVEQLVANVSGILGRRVAPHEVLIDAPPVAHEIQFEVDVFFPKQDCYRRLEEVSPVVRALAREQFDDYVKRVRIFAHPRIAEGLRGISNFDDLLVKAMEATA